MINGIKFTMEMLNTVRQRSFCMNTRHSDKKERKDTFSEDNGSIH